MKINKFWHKYIVKNKKLIGQLSAILVVSGVSFVLSLEIFSNYFFAKSTKNLYATLVQNYPSNYSHLKPFRKWNIEPPEISAKSAVIAEIRGSKFTIIYGKNQNKILPIASLSKIFTSFVALESLSPETQITISKKAIEAPTDIGFYRAGDKFLLKDLLYSVLVESSNDAIYAIASAIGERRLIDLTNKNLRDLHLEKTYFIDPIGLDPDQPYQGYNYSTAKEIAKFGYFLLQGQKNNPNAQLILKIMGTKSYPLYQTNRKFHHQVYSTNKLLNDPELQNLIVAGKTGRTPMAGECLFLILKHPQYKEGYLIIVILGSQNRFQDARSLINWTNKAFIW